MAHAVHATSEDGEDLNLPDGHRLQKVAPETMVLYFPAWHFSNATWDPMAVSAGKVLNAGALLVLSHS